MDALDEFFEKLDKVNIEDHDAVMKLMDECNLTPEEQTDAWDVLEVVMAADKTADKPENLDPINIDNVDALADAAKDMADEDKSDVKVTEVDKDEDGDSDKVTIEKEAPEKDGASDKEDNPHDQEMSEEKEPENSTNLLARHLGSLGRFE